MKLFGLIGFPLAHSFSEKYFSEKFKKENITDCRFKNFPLRTIEEFPALIRNEPALCGLNVTIPYKESVIKYLDDLDEDAKKIGAVNCIKISQKLTGYNTDSFAFEQSLKPLLKPEHRQALILGTGGAAKAVSFILDGAKIRFRFVSRTKGDFSYSELNRQILSDSLLIINTTPLGMFPETNACPDIPYQFLTPRHLLYDLIYNPEETLFLKKGKEKGTQIKNGLEMFRLQAEKTWEIWNASTNY